jgi:hypothetical protein
MSLNLDAEIARNIAKNRPQRIATKEDLRERLVTIFRLAKASHDTHEDGKFDAIFDEECAAADALIALEGDDIYMPAAKLIIAMAGEIFSEIEHECLCERLKAQAAHAALRLFRLEEMYDECFPEDLTNAEAEARLNQARRWLDAAIQTGHDPKMVWSCDFKSWEMRLSLLDNDGPPPAMPEGLKKEFIEVCESLGRLYPNRQAEATS